MGVSATTDGSGQAMFSLPAISYKIRTDHLRVVADHLGNVVKQITYDTFGNIITDTNPLFEIPLGFAGGLYDPRHRPHPLRLPRLRSGNRPLDRQGSYPLRQRGCGFVQVCGE